MHWAAQQDSLKVPVRITVRLLIEKGADVNIGGENGYTPLHVAVRNDSLGMARLLIDLGAEVEAKDNNGHTPLYFAAKNKSLDVTNMLLAKGARTSGIDMTWWSQPTSWEEQEEEYELMWRQAEDQASRHQPNIQELIPEGMGSDELDWESQDYE